MDLELDSAQKPKTSTFPETGIVDQQSAGGESDRAAINSLADKILAEQASSDDEDKGLRAQSKTYKHPMAIDLLLAVGLLFAMAGLTVSFVKTYITHSAKTSILQGNYKAAIGILHGSPIPEFFGGAGTDNSEDLLNQALYLDAMEKLDANRDDQTALQELAKVSPSQGSFYYDLAQDQFRKLKNQGHVGLDMDAQAPALPQTSTEQSGGAAVPGSKPAEGPLSAPAKKPVALPAPEAPIGQMPGSTENK